MPTITTLKLELLENYKNCLITNIELVSNKLGEALILGTDKKELCQLYLSIEHQYNVTCEEIDKILYPVKEQKETTNA